MSRGKWDKAQCPACHVGILHDGTRSELIEYRGQSFEWRRSGAYCDTCNDGIVYPDPEGERVWKEFRARIDREERENLAAWRTALGLTQLEAAKIAGGGHNAFSRYERGEARPVLGVVNLFRLLAKYPQLLRELGIQPPRGAHSRHATTAGWTSVIATTTGSTADAPTIIWNDADVRAKPN